MRLKFILLVVTGILCNGCYMPSCFCEYAPGDEIEFCSPNDTGTASTCIYVTLP